MCVHDLQQNSDHQQRGFVVVCAGCSAGSSGSVVPVCVCVCMVDSDVCALPVFVE